MTTDYTLPFDQASGELLILDGVTGIPKGVQNSNGQSLFAQILTFAQMNALTNVTNGTLVTVSDLNYAQFSYFDGKWGSTSPLQLMNAGIPFVRSGSGTIGNNGALLFSGTNALPTAYPGAYCYFPLGAIFAGTVAHTVASVSTGTSPAGWYFTQFSSSVAGTVSNNIYPDPKWNITGDPDESVPTVAGGKYATLTPFSTTGPGAFTQTTAAIVAQNYTNIPAGLIGQFGGLTYNVLADRSNNADAASLMVQVGSGTGAQTIASFSSTGISQLFMSRTLLDLGGYKQQVSPPLTLQGPGSASVNSLYTTIDFTLPQNLQIVLTALAADFYVVTGVQLAAIFS